MFRLHQLRKKRLARRPIERSHRAVGEQHRVDGPYRRESAECERQQNRGTKREPAVANSEYGLPRVPVRRVSRHQEQQHAGRELRQAYQPQIQRAMRQAINLPAHRHRNHFRRHNRQESRRHEQAKIGIAERDARGELDQPSTRLTRYITCVPWPSTLHNTAAGGTMSRQTCRNFLIGERNLSRLCRIGAGSLGQPSCNEWYLAAGTARSEFHGEPAIQTGTVTINDRERNIYVQRNFNLRWQRTSRRPPASAPMRARKPPSKKPGLQEQGEMGWRCPEGDDHAGRDQYRGAL